MNNDDMQELVQDFLVETNEIIENLDHDLVELESNQNDLELLNKIKKFNYLNIYLADPLKPSIRYFKLVLNEIYDTLKKYYDGKDTIKSLNSLYNTSPKLANSFIDFIYQYYNCGNRNNLNLRNHILFSFDSEVDYCKCILYYISGMTDKFAIDVYNEIIGF